MTKMTSKCHQNDAQAYFAYSAHKVRFNPISIRFKFDLIRFKFDLIRQDGIESWGRPTIEAPTPEVQVRFLTEILDDFRQFVDEIWRF